MQESWYLGEAEGESTFGDEWWSDGDEMGGEEWLGNKFIMHFLLDNYIDKLLQ